MVGCFGYGFVIRYEDDILVLEVLYSWIYTEY
jgi:hypothetical protein